MTTLTDKQHRNFWRKVRVNPQTGCHEWTAALDGCGYGWFRVDKGMRRAHRVAYALYYGAAPERPLIICHTCDNPRCVRREHMFPGTDADNNADMMRKGRQRSLKGTANGAALHSDAVIARVFELRAQGLSLRQISNATGVSKPHCSQVLRGNSRA